MERLNEAVKAFLADYVTAFNARDGARIATFYNALFQRLADSTMDWEMRREDGTAIRRWRQSYNLVAVDGRWRILASTIHLA